MFFLMGTPVVISQKLGMTSVRVGCSAGVVCGYYHDTSQKLGVASALLRVP